MSRGSDVVRPVEAALSYAARGWAVLPCHAPIAGGGACTCRRGDCSSPAKHPRVFGGLKAATLKPDIIESWWRRWPGANVGIRTGAASGLVVIDIDPEHGGNETWARLVDEHRGLISDTEVGTGSGGRHIYLRHPGGLIRNDTGRRLGQGVDIRGDGGYVIAPPSVHVYGVRYQWIDHLGVPPAEALPDCSPWLVERLRTPEIEPGASASPLHLSRGNHSAWAHAALEGEASRVRGAIEGTRNATLNRAAFALGQIVGACRLDRDEVEIVLYDSAVAAGLPDSEARATIDSGLSAGTLHPRWPAHPMRKPGAREPAPGRHQPSTQARAMGADVNLPSVE